MNDPRPMKTAAFVRVEETLLGAHEVAASFYMALNAPGLARRIGRLGALMGSLPAMAVLGLEDRRALRRLAYLHFRGLGEDRVAILARELYERHLTTRVRDHGRRLVARAQSEGHTVVLITSGLEDALRPLAERLGADELVGYRLEYRDGVATGKVDDPRGPDWVTRFAGERNFNLRASYAYGVDLDDVPLLSSVGFPCAVNPGRRLRRTAEDARWPVLEVSR